MATVKRTVRWFRYLLALAIGACFAFVGRSAPTWATDAKRDYSASIFQNEMQRPARRSSDSDKYALKPSLAPSPYDEDIRTLETSLFENAEVRNKIRLRVLKKLKSINFAGNPTTEELNLYNTELLQQRLDGLDARLEELEKRIPAKK